MVMPIMKKFVKGCTIAFVILLLLWGIALWLAWRGQKYSVHAFSRLEATRSSQNVIEIQGLLFSSNAMLGYVRHTAEIKGQQLYVTPYQSFGVFPIRPVNGPVTIIIRGENFPQDLNVVLCGMDGDKIFSLTQDDRWQNEDSTPIPSVYYHY